MACRKVTECLDAYNSPDPKKGQDLISPRWLEDMLYISLSVYSCHFIPGMGHVCMCGMHHIFKRASCLHILQILGQHNHLSSTETYPRIRCVAAE